MIHQVTAVIEPGELRSFDGLPATLASGVELALAEPREDGQIRLVVRKRAPVQASDLPSLRPGSDGIPLLTFPDAPVRSDLVSALHFLESFGYFLLGIERIDWTSGEEEWIPESEAERQQLRIGHLHRTLHDHEPMYVGPHLSIGEVLENYSALHELTVPFAVLRTGLEAYRHRRYYESFVHSVLYLEGMYAEGHTRAAKVIDAFAAKTQLLEAAAQVLTNLSSQNQTSHLRKTQQLLAQFKCDVSASGLLELVVRLRGRYFHLNLKLHHRGPNPLRPFELFTPSYLVISLSVLTAIIEISDLAPTLAYGRVAANGPGEADGG